jgi:hypothetical protein
MPISYHLNLAVHPPTVQIRNPLPTGSPSSSQLSISNSAIINGKSETFASTEEKFEALAAEWRRLREQGSSTDQLLNDAYGQIVAMGWPVVPLLLREVERESGHWFTALKWITGINLVTPEMRGNIRAIRESWLKWGKECDLLAKVRGENGLNSTSQTWTRATAGLRAVQPGTTIASASLSGTIGGGSSRNLMNTTGLTGFPGITGRKPMFKP